VATSTLDPACLDPQREQPDPTDPGAGVGVAPAQLQVVGPRLVRQGGEGPPAGLRAAVVPGRAALAGEERSQRAQSAREPALSIVPG